ncbi:hypothetical protein [Sphingomonas zeicaulis]|uniref:hypothetical protein n=1 Tax=Sphingomonas zeicaulis TaxID=1632740 RepID=UPI003D25E4A6
MANAATQVKAACDRNVAAANPTSMTKAEEERQARLAQALRDNLRRRKAQARGDDSPAQQADDGESSFDRRD